MRLHAPTSPYVRSIPALQGKHVWLRDCLTKMAHTSIRQVVRKWRTTDGRGIYRMGNHRQAVEQRARDVPERDDGTPDPDR